jgi:hypothetical protein
MTLHVPTHQAGYPEHRFLRFALVTVGAVALALILFVDALQVRPGVTTTTTTGPSTEQVNEFRAGERALWVLPANQTLLQNDFRAGERDLWTLP